jgi:hypothetical protein
MMFSVGFVPRNYERAVRRIERELKVYNGVVQLEVRTFPMECRVGRR